MANYIFETTTPAQAASFTADDYLVFISSGASAATVTAAPFTGTGSGSLGTSGITLTYGSQSLTFPNAISDASQADHILFNDSSHLILGSNVDTAGLPVDDTLASGSLATDTGPTVVYGFAGDDDITGGAGPDYIYGGVGDDTITGAATGNYHIYGNAGGAPVALATGQTDDDQITVSEGTNYIQGNAGEDTIIAGTGTSTGSNRIFGGADDDTITINGGQGAHAAVNGNKGDDTINVGGSGTNTIRGGMGDDTITQTGSNHSAIMGDVGADTITVSGTAGHVATLTGGADADVFDFSTSGAGAVANLTATGTSVPAGTSGSTAFYQEITDFTQGTDHITLATNPGAGEVGHSTTVFATVADAQTFAATQIGSVVGGDTIVASSLTVGSANNTFLFYSEGAGTANGVIHLDNVDASTIVGGTTPATSSFI